MAKKFTRPPPTDEEIDALLSAKTDRTLTAEQLARDVPTCTGMNSLITEMRREQKEAGLACHLEQKLAERWGIDPALAAEFASRPASLELQAKQARLLEVLQANSEGKASPKKK